jgi:hypothetical protein
MNDTQQMRAEFERRVEEAARTFMDSYTYMCTHHTYIHNTQQMRAEFERRVEEAARTFMDSDKLKKEKEEEERKVREAAAQVKRVCVCVCGVCVGVERERERRRDRESIMYYVYAGLCACMYVCNIREWMHARLYMRSQKYTYIHTHIHTYIHTNKQTYTHAYRYTNRLRRTCFKRSWQPLKKPASRRPKNWQGRTEKCRRNGSACR